MRKPLQKRINSNRSAIFPFNDTSPDSKAYATATLAVIFVSFLLHLLLAIRLELIPQETYYWLWSTVPSLSYYDHPPMIAWMIGLSTKIFGQGELAVRLPALVLSAGTGGLLYYLASLIFDRKTAFYSVLIYTAAIIYHVKGFMVDPDVPLSFFFLLAAVFFYKALHSKGFHWWVLLGIATGCSLLSKYTAILIFGSFVLVLLFSTEHRNWSNFFKLAFASVLAIAVFSPVLIWNFEHDWISFTYQSTRRSSGFAFNPGYFFGYFGSQAAVLIPFIYAAMVYALVHGLLLFKQLRDERVLFLLSFSIPFLAVFTFAATRTWVKLNWLLPGYLPLIILVAGMFYSFFPVFGEKLHQRMAQSLDWGIKLGIGLLFIGVLFFYLPFSITKEATKSLYGWEKTGKMVEELVDALVEKGEINDPFVFSHPYKPASELVYYIKKYEGTSTQFYGENDRAFNYLFPDFRVKGRDAIFLFNKKKPYYEIRAAKNRFTKWEKLDDLIVMKEGEILKEFEVYLLKNHK